MGIKYPCWNTSNVSDICAHQRTCWFFHTWINNGPCCHSNDIHISSQTIFARTAICDSRKNIRQVNIKLHCITDNTIENGSNSSIEAGAPTNTEKTLQVEQMDVERLSVPESKDSKWRIMVANIKVEFYLLFK